MKCYCCGEESEYCKDKYDVCPNCESHEYEADLYHD